MESLLSQLKVSPVFGVFSATVLEEIEKRAIGKKYQNAEVVSGQGEKWPYLFIVHSGRMDAAKDSPEGRSFVATTFLPGDVFWGLSFFDEKHIMPATLLAQDHLELFLWHREALLPFIFKEGKASWELSKLVVNRLLMASEKLGEMTFQPVGVRLAKLLVSLSKAEEGIPIDRDLTLDDMAARIGTTREMVCRFLHKFSDDGLIDITRTEFTVKDVVALNRLTSM
jgi:CRP/FNR family transcriptional regulator